MRALVVLLFSLLLAVPAAAQTITVNCVPYEEALAMIRASGLEILTELDIPYVAHGSLLIFRYGQITGASLITVATDGTRCIVTDVITLGNFKDTSDPAPSPAPAPAPTPQGYSPALAAPSIKYRV